MLWDGPGSDAELTVTACLQCASPHCAYLHQEQENDDSCSATGSRDHQKFVQDYQRAWVGGESG
jgi:hypothetical protein